MVRPIKTHFIIAPLAVLFVGLLLTAGRAADAACSCRCVNGSMQAICSSSLDIPPICPTTLCGITPPSVRPISPPVIPPIGTQNCRKKQVQNPYTGRYEWKTLCRWRIVGSTGMKKILAPILLALTFSTMFSSTSFAGWKMVTETVKGYTVYVDFERIRKHDGYVFFWQLSDSPKPLKNGALSMQSYSQADCRLFRYKFLRIVFYTGPMATGTHKSSNYNDDDWNYPLPNSAVETVLKTVCSRWDNHTHIDEFNSLSE